MENSRVLPPETTPLHLQTPESRVLRRTIRCGPAGWPELVLMFRDITRESQVDRMKSEFLSTAAHELRTPMASVLGFSELLLQRDYDKKTRDDMLGTIHRQAQWLVKMINELLDLARTEARTAKVFDPCERSLKHA